VYGQAGAAISIEDAGLPGTFVSCAKQCRFAEEASGSGGEAEEEAVMDEMVAYGIECGQVEFEDAALKGRLYI